MTDFEARREKFIAVLAEYFPKIEQGEQNLNAYLQELRKLPEEKFEAMVASIERGRDTPTAVLSEFILPFFVPNLKDSKIRMDGLLKLADELNVPIYQRVWTTDESTGQRYLTPIKYPVLPLAVRRQAQTLDGKQSIPTDTSVIDDLTGQPTGDSKGSAMTYTELQVFYAQGLENTIIEAIKVRGGDQKALNAFEREIIERGGASLQPILDANTHVKSTLSLNAYLRGMHLSSNLPHS
jgi:hypothetical protein